MKNILSVFLLSALSYACVSTGPESSVALSSSRERSFCQGWEFFREEGGASAASPDAASFRNAPWERVSVPHAAKVESPEIGGAYFLGGCWYRHAVPVAPEQAGRRVSLEFDGAMQKCDIWVDGAKVGTHLGGYLPFTLDLTPHLQVARAAGRTEVSVALHLDNNGSPLFPPGSNRIDFMYCGGLYRPVRMVDTDPVHITHAVEADRVAGGGVFVRCESADASRASVTAQTHVRNDGKESVSVEVEHILVAPDGSVAARQAVPAQMLAAGADSSFVSGLAVSAPKLWHPDHPWLYSLVSRVRKNGAVCDEASTRCGLRRLAVTDGGFILNGEKIVLRGANRHQSFPWLGYAASDNMQYRDFRLLKEEGFNFVRMAHYPQSQAAMDACDELGILALVCTPGWQCFPKNESFSDEARKNIREMVRWHRNHPSAVLWEVSLNETYGHDAFYEECSGLAKKEYPGDQLLTCGDSYGTRRLRFYDVPYTGWDGFYKRPLHPDSRYRTGFHREYGDYEFGGQDSTTRVPRRAGEAALMTQAWNFQWSHNKNLSWSWTLGDSIWAGIDVPSAFDDPKECWRGSTFGPLDCYRLPKFSYYFFQSQRDPAQKAGACGAGPMVHIAGYWTPRPSPAKVVVYSNGEEVELFLNGKSLGKRKPDSGADSEYGAYVAEADPMYWAKGQDTFAATEKAKQVKPKTDEESPIDSKWSTFDGGNCRHLDHPPFTFVPIAYEPGELKAVAYAGGKVVATHVLRTLGKPVALRLRAATLGKPLQADGADAVFVYADVVDAKGEIVPDASPAVTFHIRGAGHLVMPAQGRAETGIAPMLVQAAEQPGSVTVDASSEGLTPGTLVLEAVPSR